MKKSTTKRLCCFSLTIFISLIFLNSCGYSIHRYSELPFKEIKIGLIENKTLEPKLQDKLHKALTEEFLKHGIMIEPDADLKLSGIIHKFSLDGLSEKNGVVIEYKAIINVDFMLTDEKDETRFIKNISSPFIVSMTGSNDFGSLIANKDLAETKAMKDVAMEIVGALIYK
ncbi:MAG: hypothetical protein A2X59_11935 [Nitrospirae bacterium GWC2_42_7]|nr:MAG: hypothetical protein A2X59_11935 [Nitrospirae bacterium GWC2_42_7]